MALLQHLDSDRGVLSAVDNVGGGGLHDLAEGALAKRLLWCPVHQSISFLPSLMINFWETQRAFSENLFLVHLET